MREASMKFPSDGVGKSPFCGVLAVATVTEKSVAEVFAHMAKKYSKRGNWRGRTYPEQVVDTIRDFGVSVETLYGYGKSNKTLRKWSFKQNEIYVVWTTLHVQVVFNGVVYDQCGGVEMSKYWGRRKIVRQVCRIT